MLCYSSLSSFSRNSIYSIHYTYYSLAVSGLLSSFFMIIFLFLCECFVFSSRYNLVVFSLLCFVLSSDYGLISDALFYGDSSFFGFLFFILMLYLVYFFLSLGILYSFSLLSLLMFLFFVPLRYAVVWFMLFIFTFFLFMWINDIITECSFVFTSTEQFSLIYAIKLVILSEFMLFFCLFWTEINFRFILSVFSCFYALPLLSSFVFAIPYTNVIVLLFSSLPIQATIIFYKVGLFYCCIEQLGQTVSCGTVFLVLQLKEFFYSFHSITDCMIGSIFYFTTGLHGFHVLAGLFYFYMILCVYFFSVLFNICFAEWHTSAIDTVIFRLNISFLNYWLHDIYFFIYSSFYLSFDSSLNSAYYFKYCATFLWALLCSIYLFLWWPLPKYIVFVDGIYSISFFSLWQWLNYWQRRINLIPKHLILLVYLALLVFALPLFFLVTNYFIILLYWLPELCLFNCLVSLWYYLCLFSLMFHRVALTNQHITLIYWLRIAKYVLVMAFSSLWLPNNTILYYWSNYWPTKNNLKYKYTYLYIEFSESLFYSSYYWHFVDLIWLIVFMLYFF